MSYKFEEFFLPDLLESKQSKCIIIIIVIIIVCAALTCGG